MDPTNTMRSRFDALGVHFFTVFIKAAAIADRYPGALEGFHRDFPDARRSERLRALSAMSMQDVFHFLDALAAVGIAVGTSVAVADFVHGEIASCPGIDFIDISEGNFPHWLAVFSRSPLFEEVGR